MSQDADQSTTGLRLRRSCGIAAAIIALFIGLASLPAAAQAPTAPKSNPDTTRAERAAAKEARRQKLIAQNAALRKKQEACLQERKDKKVPVFQRPAFIRACMARP